MRFTTPLEAAFQLEGVRSTLEIGRGEPQNAQETSSLQANVSNISANTSVYKSSLGVDLKGLILWSYDLKGLMATWHWAPGLMTLAKSPPSLAHWFLAKLVLLPGEGSFRCEPWCCQAHAKILSTCGLLFSSLVGYIHDPKTNVKDHLLWMSLSKSGDPTQITKCQILLFSNFVESDLRCPDCTNANRHQLLQSSRQHGAFLPRTVAAPVGSVDVPAVPQVGPSCRKDAKIWRQAKMEAKSWRPYLGPKTSMVKKHGEKVETPRYTENNVEVWCWGLSRNDLNHCSQVTGGWSHRAQHRSTPCRFFRPFSWIKINPIQEKKRIQLKSFWLFARYFFWGGKQLRIQVWKHELWPTKINPQNFRDQWA